MTSGTYVSYAQNREDVVLHRALGSISGGHYVEVGANDPAVHSISRGFYELGWTGLTIDPVHDFVAAHQELRPRDDQVEAAITDADVDDIVLHQIAGTGLSTLDDLTGARHQEAGWDTIDVRVPARRLDEVLHESGWWDQVVHFLVVDVEGAEQSVLGSIDLNAWRPWVLVIEATAPLTTAAAHHAWEPGVTAAGYTFVLFDGLSRFYVAAEHFDDLGALMSYPACVLDDFVEHTVLTDQQERDRLLRAATDLDQARMGLLEEIQGLQVELAALRPLQAESSRLAATVADLAGRLREAETGRAQDADAIVRWRAAAFGAWSRAATNTAPAGADTAELTHLRNHTHAVTVELAAMKQTLSWRITRPLRTVRRLGKLVGR